MEIQFTDLRFLSIDFLNTFLLTYRVFTDGETVLNALKKVFHDAQPNGNMGLDQVNELLNIPGKDHENVTPRRTSGASSVSGNYYSIEQQSGFCQGGAFYNSNIFET